MMFSLCCFDYVSFGDNGIILVDALIEFTPSSTKAQNTANFNSIDQNDPLTSLALFPNQLS